MRSPTHHHNIDEDINLQKCEGGEGGESETQKNRHIYKLKPRQDDDYFEVKMYEMGQTMEEINEG